MTLGSGSTETLIATVFLDLTICLLPINVDQFLFILLFGIHFTYLPFVGGLWLAMAGYGWLAEGLAS